MGCIYAGNRIQETTDPRIVMDRIRFFHSVRVRVRVRVCLRVRVRACVRASFLSCVQVTLCALPFALE